MALATAAVAAMGQDVQPAPTPAPTPAEPPEGVPVLPAASPAGPPDPGVRLAPVEIRSTRPNETQERRHSTAAKIVIGREEIDRFGDSTLGEVLKRLPGVTLQGAPGRGGAIRLRGLGSGYTQILLDGERVPTGFSLDALTPDQIERIEILRAPTAETGARAIAGTINIVTRGGYTRRVNDVRLSVGHENGRIQPSLSWSRNLSTGPFIVNYSLSAFHYGRDSSSRTRTVARRLDDQTLTLDQDHESTTRVRGEGINATARLQWRPEGGRDTLTVTPIVFHNRFRFHSAGTLTQTVGSVDAPFHTSRGDGDNARSLLRLNGEWIRRFDDGGRFEWRAGIGHSRFHVDSVSTEASNGLRTRVLDDRSRSRDDTLTSSGKLVRTLFQDHSFVSGLEFESHRRDDARVTVQTPDPFVTDFGDNLSASSLRLAAYAQDEWNLTPNWSVHAGLRWESIRTRGSLEEDMPDASNRSSVWSPLLHAVWKPDPASRDQVRMSLTRSYRAPLLAQLIARPVINTRYGVGGPNTPTQPDRAGNAGLRPELATGIDIAVERYLGNGGILSANVFRRQIRDYMRSVTTLEAVSYSAVPRYVLRPRNIGEAMTQGIELEAKFRASDLWPTAPRIDVRANASAFSSRVESVGGPDNRLDQQPGYTANLGADYRLRGLPLTIGGNANWTPGYTTRLSETQTAFIGRKLVFDAYALWVLNPALQLRLTLSNLDPDEYVFAGSVDGPDAQGVPVRETSRTTQPTHLHTQLRLEMKL
jgi:iron complex outermembrane receptor protein